LKAARRGPALLAGPFMAEHVQARKKHGEEIVIWYVVP
jgi:hypothetical protein